MERFEFVSQVGNQVVIGTTSKLYLVSITEAGTLFAETCPRPIPQVQAPETPSPAVEAPVATPSAPSEPTSAAPETEKP